MTKIVLKRQQHATKIGPIGHKPLKITTPNSCPPKYRAIVSTCSQNSSLSSLFTVLSNRPNAESIDSQNNKKSELIITRRAKTFSSSGSVV